MRALLVLLSFPFVVFSRVAEAVNLWDFRSDIAICLTTVDRTRGKSSVPTLFIRTLIAAEDHRNRIHFGIDPIGMLRAALSFVTGSGLQGASTIEQQFVRVVTNRYERTFYRKVREQALAIALSRRRSKIEISTAYLCVAFYGHGLIGASGLTKLCGHVLAFCPPQTVYEAVARLKYPQPLHPTYRWSCKLKRRTTYISCRFATLSGELAASEYSMPFVPISVTSK